MIFYHVYGFYHVWHACYGCPPDVDDVARWGGVPRGLVWACLWQLGLLR